MAKVSDQEFIDKLISDMSWMDNPSGVQNYAHAHVVVDSFDRAVTHLCIALARDLPPVPGLYTGCSSHPSVIAARCTEGCLLLVNETEVGLCVSLSRDLQAEVHWISVLEEFSWRAYIHFSRGKVRTAILDPVAIWQSSVYTGEMSQPGTHRFASYDEFLAAVSQGYVPIDETLRLKFACEQLRCSDPPWQRADLLDLIGVSRRHGVIEVAPLGGWETAEFLAFARNLPGAVVESADIWLDRQLSRF